MYLFHLCVTVVTDKHLENEMFTEVVNVCYLQPQVIFIDLDLDRVTRNKKAMYFRAYKIACVRCSRANVPRVLTCSRANVSCVLTCLRANVLCVLACSRA